MDTVHIQIHCTYILLSAIQNSICLSIFCFCNVSIRCERERWMFVLFLPFFRWQAKQVNQHRYDSSSRISFTIRMPVFVDDLSFTVDNWHHENVWLICLNCRNYYYFIVRKWNKQEYAKQSENACSAGLTIDGMEVQLWKSIRLRRQSLVSLMTEMMK